MGRERNKRNPKKEETVKDTTGAGAGELKGAEAAGAGEPKDDVDAVAAVAAEASELKGAGSGAGEKTSVMKELTLDLNRSLPLYYNVLKAIQSILSKHAEDSKDSKDKINELLDLIKEAQKLVFSDDDGTDKTEEIKRAVKGLLDKTKELIASIPALKGVFSTEDITEKGAMDAITIKEIEDTDTHEVISDYLLSLAPVYLKLADTSSASDEPPKTIFLKFYFPYIEEYTEGSINEDFVRQIQEFFTEDYIKGNFSGETGFTNNIRRMETLNTFFLVLSTENVLKLMFLEEFKQQIETEFLDSKLEVVSEDSLTEEEKEAAKEKNGYIAEMNLADKLQKMMGVITGKLKDKRASACAAENDRASEVEALKTKLAEKEDKLTNSNTTIAMLRSILEELSKDLTAKEKAFDSELLAIKDELEKAKEAFDLELLATGDELEETKVELVETKEALTLELNAAKEEKALLDKELCRIKQRYASISSINERLSSAIEELKKTNVGLRKEIGELKAPPGEDDTTDVVEKEDLKRRPKV